MFMIAATVSSALCASPTTFNLDFDGGTVAEWVASIRTAWPEANVVVADAIKDASVPAMFLHGVTLDGVMEVSGMNVDTPINCDKAGSSGASIWVVSSKYKRPTRSSSRQSTVRAGQGTEAVQDDLMTAVFTLPHGHRDQAGAASLVEAITRVTAMDGGVPLGMMLMPDVGLLAVRGPEAQIDTARVVIESIERIELRDAHIRAKDGVE